MNRGEAPSPGGAIYNDGLWRVDHIVEPLPMLGWLVAKPFRHITMLSDLTTPEAAALGPLIQSVAAALGQVLRPAKVYSVLFSEHHDFSHIHFHLIPRRADLPTELRGPGVFRLLEKALIDGNLADPNHAAAVAARISALLPSNG